MARTRRNYDPEFKLQLILEVLQGKKITDIAKEYDIHYSLLSKWKSDFLSAGQTAFISTSQANSEKELKLKKLEEENNQMKKIIGEQHVQLEILKKNLGWIND